MPQTHIAAVPGNQDLWITREFDAPREKVFRAFTDPALLVQWLGPRGLRMEIDYMDCRTGGSYRYVHIDPAGHAYGFNGVIHEVTAPERIIQTFEFEGLPERGHVSLETALFEALPDGRTRVRIQSVFRSAEDRDGMVASGMEHGVVDSHSRLDELFAQDQSPS
jgi:uncharacterized protein YndB with AHSA1/START domain